MTAVNGNGSYDCQWIFDKTRLTAEMGSWVVAPMVGALVGGAPGVVIGCVFGGAYSLLPKTYTVFVRARLQEFQDNVAKKTPELVLAFASGVKHDITWLFQDLSKGNGGADVNKFLQNRKEDGLKEDQVSHASSTEVETAEESSGCGSSVHIEAHRCAQRVALLAAGLMLLVASDFYSYFKR